jgi:hypothetical protein
MLSEQLLAILRDYCRRARPTEYLFPGSNPSRPLTTRSVQRECRWAVNAAGLSAAVPCTRCGKMFGEHLLAIRCAFVFLRPFDEVADSVIGAGNTHVEVLRISVSSVSSVGLQDTGSHRRDYNFPRIACHPKAFSSASIKGGRAIRSTARQAREGVQYSSSGIRLAYSAS